MSPTQYRALEKLLDAARGDGPWPGLLVARGPDVGPGRIHPRTADALERRGLVTRRHSSIDDDELIVITDAGVGLLARRSEPIESTS